MDVPVWARDEIGEVQDEFNLMVRDLRGSHPALSQQRKELQKLNHENTRLLDELNAKNSRLEQLVSSRDFGAGSGTQTTGARTARRNRAITHVDSVALKSIANRNGSGSRFTID